MNQESPTEYDVFVSYAEADHAWVEGYLLDALGKAGLRYHTEAAFELGAPRLLNFEQAIARSRRTLLVLSPAYLVGGANQFVELLAQSYGQETGTWPVIPLILRPVSPLPLRLAMLSAIDASDEAGWAEAVARLVNFLGRPAAAPEPLPPPPYPGMRTFHAEESGRFYGRQQEVEQLATQLRAQPFVALIGSSGSGKSSLVYAGLIPYLQQATIFGPGDWLIRPLRPGEAPEQALRHALNGEPAEPEAAVAALLQSQPNARRLLLFIDQFEELFTIARGDSRPFEEAIVRLAQLPDTYVLLAARADFYPDLMRTLLWPAIQKSRYELLPLGEKALAQAIGRPAESVGVYVEPALVERLVADAGGEPGVLPFIQETMILLWDRVERRYLPLSAYEKLVLILPRRAYGENTPGKWTGLQVAMALRADATWAGLDGPQQQIARRIFVRLVQFVEGRPAVRRQQPVSRLRVAADDPALFDRTLNYLADESHRLLTLTGEAGDPERQVDIAHETLIAAWPTLRQWLDQQRQTELLRRRLADDTEEWLAKVKDGFFLYEGSRLAEAEQLVNENPEEVSREQQEFLTLSRQRDQRRRQVQAFVRGVIALFALVGLLATGYAARYGYLNWQARGPMVAFVAGPAGSPLAPFSLDKYEVNYRQYRLCMQAGRCLRPSEPNNVLGIDEADERLPVVFVNAYQAAAFCHWIGRRLPTQAEWQQAARGSATPPRPWPWGEADPTPELVHIFLPDFGTPPLAGSVPVNDPAFSGGATPEGIMHLLGNVREWTSTLAECASPAACPTIWDGQARTGALNTVGLSWTFDLVPDEWATVYDGLASSAVHFEWDLGFRCADSS